MRQSVAGRIQATTGFLNELVRDDILRQKNLGIVLTPLQEKLWKRREEISPVLEQSNPPLDHEFTNLKTAIEFLRNLVGTITEEGVEAENSKGNVSWRKAEHILSQAEMRRLQQCLAEQSKANQALERHNFLSRV